VLQAHNNKINKTTAAALLSQRHFFLRENLWIPSSNDGFPSSIRKEKIMYMCRQSIEVYHSTIMNPRTKQLQKL
jgi:hypothetical protein